MSSTSPSVVTMTLGLLFSCGRSDSAVFVGTQAVRIKINPGNSMKKFDKRQIGFVGDLWQYLRRNISSRNEED